MYIKFNAKDRQVVYQGDPSLTKLEVMAKNLLKTTEIDLLC